MGQYADDIIEGRCDSSGDYTYKCNKKYSGKHKDTLREANVRKVRQELAILIKLKLKEYPETNQNEIVGKCRKYINLKYGKGWRERGIAVNDPIQWAELHTYIAPPITQIFEII